MSTCSRTAPSTRWARTRTASSRRASAAVADRAAASSGSPRPWPRRRSRWAWAAAAARAASRAAIQVDSDADIETVGDKSHGIFAQSVGGGGGTGGYTATVDLEPDSEGPTSQTLAVSVGGDGGTASTSSTVDVANRGLILTHGNESHGINAESTGGGGGAGGAVLSVGSSADDTSRSLSVNVGGTGGDGGVSDKVTVLNEGSIETGGDNSIGIRARSIGGKGGDGGLILNLGLVRVGPNQSATRLTVNVGGDGAIGGVSGDVEVTNRAQAGVPDTGVIVTHGHESHGIFAQSIGGGGGNGSSVITSNLGTSMSGQVTVVDLAFGGKGGQGSIAGDVTVTNDSVIDTRRRAGARHLRAVHRWRRRQRRTGAGGECHPGRGRSRDRRPAHAGWRGRQRRRCRRRHRQQQRPHHHARRAFARHPRAVHRRRRRQRRRGLRSIYQSGHHGHCRRDVGGVRWQWWRRRPWRSRDRESLRRHHRAR